MQRPDTRLTSIDRPMHPSVAADRHHMSRTWPPARRPTGCTWTGLSARARSTPSSIGVAPAGARRPSHHPPGAWPHKSAQAAVGRARPAATDLPRRRSPHTSARGEHAGHRQPGRSVDLASPPYPAPGTTWAAPKRHPRRLDDAGIPWRRPGYQRRARPCRSAATRPPGPRHRPLRRLSRTRERWSTPPTLANGRRTGNASSKLEDPPQIRSFRPRAPSSSTPLGPHPRGLSSGRLIAVLPGVRILIADDLGGWCRTLIRVWALPVGWAIRASTRPAGTWRRFG